MLRRTGRNSWRPGHESQIVDILSLDHEGHGIARIDGKVTFVDGALAGERAEITVYRKHAKYNSANAVAILKASAQRTEPRCKYFGRCGGCSMQHLEASAQVAAKQRVLEDNLARIGKVKPDIILPALHGPSWGYRTRARLSARWVDKKGGGLVGFREKRSSFIADMASCEVLTPDVSALIQPLRELIGELSNADRIPQIEVAVGEHVTVLVFRLLEPWTDDDAAKVRAFADQHRVQVWEQAKGPDTVRPFWPDIAPELSYSLPEFGLVMPFKPTDFTQVNIAINRALVSRAHAPAEPAAGRTHRRPVLRAGQLHPAHRHAAAPRCWASRAAPNWSPAPAKTRCTTSCPTPASRSTTCSR